MTELLFLDSSALAPEPPPDDDDIFDERPPDPNFDEPLSAQRPEPKSGWPVCEQCGKDITTYGGRGRRPKLCNDCKGVPGNSAPRKRAAPKVPDNDGRLTYIAEGLIEYAGYFAGAIGAFAPIAGATLMMKASRSCSALVEVAAMNHPKLLAGLERFVAGRPYAIIVETVTATAYGAAVDFGQATPEGLIAESLGVAEAARRMGWQPPTRQDYVPANTGGGFLNTPPPPNFHLPEMG